jgi:hypothetical protein
MGFTNFPNGITSLGVPTFGTGIIPPFPSKYFFVQETTTAGVAAGSGTAAAPFNTLDQALAACTAGANDVVFLTGTVHVTAAVAWSKNNTHLVGLCAPSDNDRARISASGSTVFTPLVNVTASGCIFMDIGTFHGFANASAQICWAEAGGRNFYQGCQFLGMGNATAAAHVGSRSLTIAGSGENKFYDCTIGLDTIARGAANASLELLSGTPRNVMRGCIFQMLASAGTPLHITVGSGGMDRYLLLDKCSLINCVDSGGSTISAAIVANASAGGTVLVQDGFSVGATAIATTGPVRGTGNIPTATTSGIAIALT